MATDYLLIESRDPFEHNDAGYFHSLAADLRKAGNTVTVFLVQNGVLPARPGRASSGLTALAAAGVLVRADRFSLRERGIPEEKLVAGVEAEDLGGVIDRLVAGSKTFWH
jgi:intracellular sulfur oxidation DsrE/DsrF family protein